MNKKLVCGIALWAMQMLAYAQSDSSDIPPPAPPFIQFPKPDMAVTITVTNPDGQPIKPPPPSDPSAPKSPQRDKVVVKVDAVQVGALRGDTISYDDNSQTQTWFVGKYGLVGNPMGDRVNLVDPVKYPPQKSLMPRRDASDYFSWLSSSNYVKVVSYRGTKCYQFKIGEGATTTTDEDNMDISLGPNEKIAWIDAKTHYPVAIQLQKRLYAYTFTNPPDGPLVLPPKFKALADRYQLLGPPSPSGGQH